MSHALLVDLTACVGCGACREACQTVHGFPVRETNKLDAKNFTRVELIETKNGDEVYVRQMCRHCQEPACASACPVGALEKQREGAVTYDASKCLGCRYCMLACPFDIPKYEWDKLAPKVRKCTMCYQERHLDPDNNRVDEAGFLIDASGSRVTIDGEALTPERRDEIVEMTTNADDIRATACSVACPMEATIYGDHDELLAEAIRRIHEDPDTYVQKVYGQREVGGTSVFYVSGVPFEELGFSTTLDTNPLPERTWQVLSKIPDIVMTAGVALGAVYWITHRRDEVRRYEQLQKQHADNTTNDTKR
jgi:formate dehydrogenase iron-sulfur subunit